MATASRVSSGVGWKSKRTHLRSGSLDLTGTGERAVNLTHFGLLTLMNGRWKWFGDEAILESRFGGAKLGVRPVWGGLASAFGPD